VALTLAFALVSSPPRPGNEAVQVMRYFPALSVEEVAEEMTPPPGDEPVVYHTAVHPNVLSVTLYEDM
jgi:hypothetical protein